MSNRIVALTSVTLALFAATAAQAQFDSDTASGSASANVVTAISITNTAGLDFGDLVAGATSGTVVMTAAGVRTSTGGTTLGNPGAAAAAGFAVAGDPAATYAITLPTSITVTSGGDTMTVDTFTTPAATGTLDGTGNDTIAVGATLQVGVAQAVGAYTGTFDVTVAYN